MSPKSMKLVFLLFCAANALKISTDDKHASAKVQWSERQSEKGTWEGGKSAWEQHYHTLASIINEVYSVMVVSLATSVDNLAVAMAVGIAGMELLFLDCFIIAAVGGLATGLADLATTVAGQWLQAVSQLCAVFFIGLGLNEFWNYYQGTHSDEKGKEEEETTKSFLALGKQQLSPWALAVPLSLNNLAGGAAGGLAGAAFWKVGLGSAAATLIFMVAGNFAGRKLGVTFPFSTEILAGLAFVAIGIYQLFC
eukprot:gnl/MRDRNA2_/MRDRNA2_135439_c0_seq1.p1 gnl/MRDRNA2_/MRDRNA2_135439_c0~~gnl/MRDRNA2_/MRDRNA2_135439_c0_seq1.p1  ORF type:complete len:252 (-),score=47.26 gnl/MRDRNA2_/MRDRNA2_135439_c0_seq1:138-893(-)